jgi:hypothetical protein
MVLVFLFFLQDLQAQNNKFWHGIERSVHYRPDGQDFVLVEGKRRFNRALYGSNSGFRVEAGDLPEFALYLPGMGGHLRFGVVANDQHKWLSLSDSIHTRYRPGSMIYTIADRLIEKGSIHLTVLALMEGEGILVKMEAKNIPAGISLVTIYGGATGRRFSRDGDIGADPESSFDPQPAYCRDNFYKLEKNRFQLFFGTGQPLTSESLEQLQSVNTIDSGNVRSNLREIHGIFPPGTTFKTSDAEDLNDPANAWASADHGQPVLAAKNSLNNSVYYFLIRPGKMGVKLSYEQLPLLFQKTEDERAKKASRIQLNTPDPQINTLGGALSMAADAIWEDPSFMHGAVAWRMRLNGWRGAYTADMLGWHDRAKKHFSSYAKSQLTSPLSAPVVMDTALNLARGLEKLGTSLFSSGYISRNPNGDFRAHHYDMNLVFIDQLLHHFNWTGDTAYVREMWPLLQRHLDWEKRNFDTDGDGLYDAYAAIWASDALQYSGGGVTHSTAYNYRANKMAAELANMLGENAEPFQREANHIQEAANRELWMKDKGWYAEYKDLLGNRLVHPSAALWTIYHAIESGLPDAFQAWQSLDYVQHHYKKIPIRAKGLKDSTLYTIPTSNWQPYTWSLNNVVLAELLHTSLAYWQGNRKEDAFRLWKSSLVESMYLGASPGNFQQLSFYDAIRKELYRDFADGIGMAARSLVEGLFGIRPDALHRTLVLQPGFPSHWNHSRLSTPDIDFSFQRSTLDERYHIVPKFPVPMKLRLIFPAIRDQCTVLVNGKTAAWKPDTSSILIPNIIIELPVSPEYRIQVKWKGEKFHNPELKKLIHVEEHLEVLVRGAEIIDLSDPAHMLGPVQIKPGQIKTMAISEGRGRTFFIRLKQGSFSYWMPITMDVKTPVEIIEKSPGEVEIRNYTAEELKGQLVINHLHLQPFQLQPKSQRSLQFSPAMLLQGVNAIEFRTGNKIYNSSFTNWDEFAHKNFTYEQLDLSAYYNDDVKNIFTKQYFSPRPTVSTLQLPVQGIGNWAYPHIEFQVNDSGLRYHEGSLVVKGIPFSTVKGTGKNILFTSQWDRYPDSAFISLSGKARHLYLLMTGSTNAMQSRMTNGLVKVYYTDGSKETLELKNPENWWPVEQDYLDDEFAFTTDAPRPVRIQLKNGKEIEPGYDYHSIRGFTGRAIEGGAASLLDLPLNPMKELKSVQLVSRVNDVVMGILALTLLRN